MPRWCYLRGSTTDHPGGATTLYGGTTNLHDGGATIKGGGATIKGGATIVVGGATKVAASATTKGGSTAMASPVSPWWCPFLTWPADHTTKLYVCGADKKNLKVPMKIFQEENI